VLAEAAFAAGEIDEINLLPSLGIFPPVLVDGRVALQA
jgi:hypothetical protein